jgi:hypothetical protein
VRKVQTKARLNEEALSGTHVLVVDEERNILLAQLAAAQFAATSLSAQVCDS